jgi:hypothetical protein
MKHLFKYTQRPCLIICCLAAINSICAQTDADGLMMPKHNFCTGLMYNYSSWDNYWEGTNKRDNANLGTVSTQSLSIMGNYGVTRKLNFLFFVPYVKTKASAGQLHGLQGIQDLSLWLKYVPEQIKAGPGNLTLYTIAGVSLPLSDYTPDFLPMSIGLHTKNVSLRGMADYQVGDWFITASGTYVLRSNVKIYRTSYYTTEMHYTNEVKMPDASQFNVRLGYRTHRLIAEGLLNNWTTLGGFDITKNNMPFPSNKMNMTSVGVNLKYTVNNLERLSIIGGGDHTIAGRNVGQATGYYAGIFYILDFYNPKKSSNDNKKD